MEEGHSLLLGSRKFAVVLRWKIRDQGLDVRWDKRWSVSGQAKGGISNRPSGTCIPTGVPDLAQEK
jgi:hypothetical protein